MSCFCSKIDKIIKFKTITLYHVETEYDNDGRRLYRTSDKKLELFQNDYAEPWIASFCIQGKGHYFRDRSQHDALNKAYQCIIDLQKTFGFNA